jgi:hypothetical protein
VHVIGVGQVSPPSQGSAHNVCVSNMTQAGVAVPPGDGSQSIVGSTHARVQNPD